MTIDIFSSAEQALLDAWFRSAPIDGEVLGLTSKAEAMAWRAEAWAGHADIEAEEEEPDEDPDEEVMS